MANADSLFSSLLGAGVGGLFNLGSTALGNASNRRIQREQNEFNADQARLNREFQAQQAQIARDWQEEQYNKYSSPSAMVNQYKEAGLNPALMYGANLQSGTGSSPSASGSTAGGSAIPNQIANMTGIISDFLGLAQLKANIDKTKSEADVNRAYADKSRSDIDLNKQTIAESQSRISKMYEETKSESVKRGLMVAQTLLAEEEKKLKSNQSISISFDNLKKQFEQNYFEKFGIYPESNVTSAVLQMFGQGVAEIEHFGGKLSNFIGKLFK